MKTRKMLIRCILLIAGMLILLLLALPTPAQAEAPITRGAASWVSGGVGSTDAATDAALLWRDVEPLPLPGALVAPATSAPGAMTLAPISAPQGQLGGVLPWLTREVNVGNWALDMVLGGGAALSQSTSESMASAFRDLIGMRQASASATGLTISCEDATLNFLICTPPNLLLDPATGLGRAVRGFWRGLRPLATAIITILFTVGLWRLLRAGTATLRTEGTELVISFVLTALAINSAEWWLHVVLLILNAIHSTLFAILSADRPLTFLELASLAPPPGLNFGASVVATIFWIALFILLYKGYARMLKLGLLIALTPAMCALLLDRATRPRFVAWLNRLIDVLLEQTVWVFFLVVSTLLLRFGNGALGDTSDPVERVSATVQATLSVIMTITGSTLLAGLSGNSGGSFGVARLFGQALGYWALARKLGGAVRRGAREGVEETFSAAGIAPAATRPQAAGSGIVLSARRGPGGVWSVPRPVPGFGGSPRAVPGGGGAARPRLGGPGGTLDGGSRAGGPRVPPRVITTPPSSPPIEVGPRAGLLPPPRHASSARPRPSPALRGQVRAAGVAPALRTSPQASQSGRTIRSTAPATRGADGDRVDGQLQAELAGQARPRGVEDFRGSIVAAQARLAQLDVREARVQAATTRVRTASAAQRTRMQLQSKRAALISQITREQGRLAQAERIAADRPFAPTGRTIAAAPPVVTSEEGRQRRAAFGTALRQAQARNPEPATARRAAAADLNGRLPAHLQLRAEQTPRWTAEQRAQRQAALAQATQHVREQHGTSGQTQANLRAQVVRLANRELPPQLRIGAAAREEGRDERA